MKKIHQIQYISQGVDRQTHLDNIQAVLDAGILWVQLRMKNSPAAEILQTAHAARAICKQYGATFIVNDRVDTALESGADGVHLGKEDMSPDEARRLLGTDKIIGGTANTFEDVQQLHNWGVDYIGLGPYRFTATKKKLSPILGLEGYARIIAQMQEKGIETPIFAIGGICADDFPLLSTTGVYGVAVSGWLTENAVRLSTLGKMPFL